MFTSLTTAQQLAGAPGQVNEVVVAWRPARTSGPSRRRREDGARRRAARPGRPRDRRTRSSYRILYEDIEGDEQFWRIIAMLMLVGATFAAFNLTTRVVEAQRREIGIGMALGCRAGTSRSVRCCSACRSPSSAWCSGSASAGHHPAAAGCSGTCCRCRCGSTPFPSGTFLQAAAFGFVLPLVAVAWPVWRAVRVEPVEAIRVGHLAARGAAVRRCCGGFSLPGRSYCQMPVRNVLRTPRRTVLTALGIGAAIATLVAVFGILDSFTKTLDDFDAETTRSAPDRVTVQFAEVLPETSPQVAEVTGADEVGDSATTLVLEATARTAAEEVPLAVSVRDIDGGLWRPSISGGDPADAAAGIVLSEVAARDLGVVPGDRILLEHPQRTAQGVTRPTTPIVVAGTHPGPIRAVSYLDRSQAEAFGAAGLVTASR